MTTRTLGDICDEVKGIIRTGPFGSQLHESDYCDEGTPVVMPKNIIEGHISVEDIARIGDENLERLSQHKLYGGDIVYGRRGDIGRRALITKRETGWLCGTGCLRISLGTKVLAPTYLYYYLGQPKITAWIYNQAIGATLPNLNTSIIRNVSVVYPHLSAQHKIASILSAYDDLLENNTRRIQILEEMAQMIYREWFVHFRFPGHEQVRIVDSEMGKIPERWKIRKLADFGKVITGKTPSKNVSEYYGNYMPFIKTPSMHGTMFCTEVEEFLSELGVDSQRNKTLPPNSLIVNCIGALAGSISITTIHSQTNQQINAIVLNNREAREFLYFVLVDLRETIRRYGSTGATMINLSKGKFESLPTICPDDATMSVFHEITSAQFDLIRNLLIKNISLRQTRDLLLPKLISGEIDIEDLDIDIRSEDHDT